MCDTGQGGEVVDMGEVGDWNLFAPLGGGDKNCTKQPL